MSFLIHYTDRVLSSVFQTHTVIMNQCMNLNNGDNKQKSFDFSSLFCDAQS